jgi:outer membrane lipoprotein-sorting protein
MIAQKKLSGRRFWLLLLNLLPLWAYAAAALEPEDMIERMTTAYAGVQDYQSVVEVIKAARDGSLIKEEFRYTFKKPNRIRLEFETPYKGTVVIYPDKDRKVVVRLWGLRGVFELHVAPQSFLLRVGSGQRVDQTDLGLLIGNVAQSLRQQRRGEVKIVESESQIRISVVADDHFREGVITRYRFSVDKKTWLPSEIEEWTSQGTFERKIIFHDLKTNIGVPDSTFD